MIEMYKDIIYIILLHRYNETLKINNIASLSVFYTTHINIPYKNYF